MTWGHPNFRVGKKIFASFDNYHGEACIAFKAEPQMQDLLLTDPRYFRAPYVGNQGWVCMRTAGRFSWKRLTELLHESYRLVAAPRRVSAPSEPSPPWASPRTSGRGAGAGSSSRPRGRR